MKAYQCTNLNVKRFAVKPSEEGRLDLVKLYEKGTDPALSVQCLIVICFLKKETMSEAISKILSIEKVIRNVSKNDIREVLDFFE